MKPNTLKMTKPARKLVPLLATANRMLSLLAKRKIFEIWPPRPRYFAATIAVQRGEGGGGFLSGGVTSMGEKRIKGIVRPEPRSAPILLRGFFKGNKVKSFRAKNPLRHIPTLVICFAKFCRQCTRIMVSTLCEFALNIERQKLEFAK